MEHNLRNLWHCAILKLKPKVLKTPQKISDGNGLFGAYKQMVTLVGGVKFFFFKTERYIG